jgi:chemosensory pili system protein ChpA (sensor histidine kinase/response regulator)
LLLLETSTQHLAALPRTFAAEVSTALKRLGYASSRAPIPSELVDGMGSGSLTRMAQERETVAQVCREIRANMRQVEAALDAVFRDSSAVEDLAAVPGLLAQVSGALRLLGWNDAHQVISTASERVASLVSDPSALDSDEIDRIANVLAGFGFYVDARERKEAGADAILESLQRTLRGEEALPTAPSSEHSVELALGSRIRGLKTEIAQLRANPGDDRAKSAVVAGLNDVRRDAELLDDASLARAAKSGLNLLTSGVPDLDALQAELSPVLGSAPAPVPVSVETQRILDASPASQDTALLEIFIEEADEVVANIEGGIRDYVQSPSRRDLLVDIRRGFHTLKGSGRMVGLQAFGDASWNVERVLNPVLEESRSLNANEIELVSAAVTTFRRWVGELQASGQSSASASAFDAHVVKCGFTPASTAATIAAVAPVDSGVDASSDSGIVDEILMVELPSDSSESQNSRGETTDGLSFELPTLETSNASIVSAAPPLAPVQMLAEPVAATPFVPPPIEPVSIALTPAVTDVAAPLGFDSAPTLEPAAALPSTLDELPPLAPPSWNDDLDIDGVRVSRTLFSIMGDEARAHLATLDEEVTLMQFDPGLLPSDAMVRASHTLCGIHRTAGFADIGALAGLLEEALLLTRRSKRVEENLALIADSVETLRTAVLRLQAQMPSSASEKQMLAAASSRLESLIAAVGGERGGVAEEMARASVAEESGFEIEEEIILDLPDDFGSPKSIVMPSATSLDPANEPAAVSSPSSRDSDSAPLNLQTDSTAADEALEPVARIDAPKENTASFTSTPAIGASPSQTPPDIAALGAAFGVGALSVAAAASAAPPVAATPPTASPPETAAAAPVAAVSVPIDMRVNTPFTAAPLPVASPPSNEDPLIGINDDIDTQVLPIFLEEAEELFPAASAQIRTLRSSPNDRDNLDSLKRTLHTLKGSARMAGAMRLGELTHIVESTVGEKHDGWTGADFDRLEERFDDVAFVLDQLVAGKYDVVLPRFVAPSVEEAAQTSPFDAAAESAAALIAEHVETGKLPSDADVVAELPKALEAAVRDAASLAPPSAGVPSVTAVPAMAAATTPAAAAAVPTAQESAVAFLRVRSDAVELLADEAGEIAINRSRIESELRGLKSSLGDLTSFVVRLRTLLREIEIQGESQIQSRLDQESTFDPLEFDRYTRFQELTRGLAEGVNDVGTVQQNLLKNIDDAETALAAQTRLSRSVQLRLQSLRTVPFSTVSERLYRVLRQTAKDVGKRANLEIEGGRIEIDRGVLERLIPVLEHLVRNSLAHGIEAPNERQAASKDVIGEINIAVKQQGNEVAIVFSDDGGGIALERVRQRAIAVGLANAGDSLNDAQLIEFIFRPGFSTAESVTAVAGRGVGMDVVRSELAALGGRVVAATSPGVGTTFTLSVPLTLAVTQVLLVEIAGVTYGIPSSLIETVRQVPARDRTIALAAKQMDLAGKFIPFRSMSVLLGGRPDGTVHKTYSVAIIRAGEAVAGIEIDRVIGNQEVVAKPYGPQLARVPGMAGLTVLGDGKIVLLMDPLALLRASAEAVDRSVVATVAAPVAATAAAAAPTPPIAATVAAEDAPASATTRDAVDADAVTGRTDPGFEPVAPIVHAAPPIAEPAVPVAVAQPPVPEPEVVARLPIVLVVDDSLTVRKITSRLLEREGYKALTAKDGLDALQVLADVNPDVILLDIEMPRMDGFEFTKTIKADNRQNNIPIIMITSRTAEKHRNHAKELGVDEYLGKPYQDDQLLGLIGKYTAHVVRPN